MSVRPKLFSSSCATGSHRSKNFGRNNSVNVERNCRLIEQYRIKFIAELISANMSVKSPEINLENKYVISILEIGFGNFGCSIGLYALILLKGEKEEE